MRDEPPLARRVLPALAVALLTLAVFFPARNAGIINLDDVNTLVNNRAIHAWTWANLKTMWTSFDLIPWGGVYQPVAWMTHAFDYWYWGDRYAGHHLTSLLFHAANAGLLFLFLEMLLWRAWPQERRDAVCAAAALGAIAWAINPVRVMPAGCLALRGYLVATFFGLISLIAYVAAQRSGATEPPWRRRAWLAACWLAYTLSLCSKAIGLTLPLTLLALDVWPLRRVSRRFRWRQAGALILEKLLIFVSGVALYEISMIGRRHWNPGLPFSLKSMLSHESLCQFVFENSYFLEKTILPFKVLGIYERRLPWHPFDSFFGMRTLALAAVTIAVIAARRRWPAGALSWFGYAVTLAPLSGLVRYDVLNQISQDKYGYLATIWLGVGAGFAALALLRAGSRSRWRAWASRAALAAAALGLATVTWAQARLWADQDAWWNYSLAVNPDCYLCRIVLGIDYAGRPDRRKDALELAIDNLDRWPDDAPGELSVARTMEAAISGMPEPDKARALARIRRLYWETPKSAVFHAELASWHQSQGRLDDAMQQLALVLKYDPQDVASRLALAGLYDQRGSRAAALETARRAAKDAGTSSQLQFQVGLSLGNLGDVDGAIKHMLLAVKYDPSLRAAHFDLAIFYGNQKQFALAAAQGAEAVRLDPKNAPARHNLGFFYLQLGRLRDAERQFKEGLRLDPNAINTKQNLAYVEGLLAKAPGR